MNNTETASTVSHSPRGRTPGGSTIEKSALFMAKHENETRVPGDITELLIVPSVGHPPSRLTVQGKQSFIARADF